MNGQFKVRELYNLGYFGCLYYNKLTKHYYKHEKQNLSDFLGKFLSWYWSYALHVNQLLIC